MSDNSIKEIVICGGGLAAWMSAATLSKSLPGDINITVLETPNSSEADIFYGTVTSPKAYNFYHNLGLSEADLLLQTQTAFSYGTQYENWGLTGISWTQCFHTPLPVWDGVPFTHHITSEDKNLEEHLVSAQAAIADKFAHPPADKHSPLSYAEYGYHINPRELTKLLKTVAMHNGAKYMTGGISTIDMHDGQIQSLYLDNDVTLLADLYVDGTGPEAQLLSKLGKNEFQPQRELSVIYSESETEQLGPPLRKVTSSSYGWHSETPLQGYDLCMTIFKPHSENEARQDHLGNDAKHFNISTGRREQAWSSNCVGIGHAIGVLEPVSPAPMMLLQMDIERLLGLIPATHDMGIETQIYRNSFQVDIENTQLFNNAFYQLESLPDTPYWKMDKMNHKLERKLTQFNHRGLLVNYDLDPFNEEDWAILHYGIGRKPKKKNPFSKLSDTTKINRKLENMSHSITDIVAKMPPHHVYVAKFLNYLERNHVSKL